MRSSSLFAAGAFAAILAFPAVAAEGDEMSMFEQLDSNRDGKISMDESARSAQVTADFRQIDSNVDGAITPEEWRSYFGSTGAPGGTAPAGGGRGSGSY